MAVKSCISSSDLIIPNFRMAKKPIELVVELLSEGVTGVTADSRAVKHGMIFVATRGAMKGSADGHSFIEQALKSGAVAIVGESPVQASYGKSYVQVPDSRLALSQLAAEFHGKPSSKMLMIGVTGTSGKTTTTYLIESILKAAGHCVGLIGTVEFRYADKVLDSTHTTPGAVELHALLAEMKRAGCSAVVMEVSSHALKQHRVAHIEFDGMVFTNLTREHLDFHPDMEDYYLSKKMLFSELAQRSRDAGKRPVAAICTETEYGKRLASEISSEGVMKEVRDFQPAQQGVSLSLRGIHGEMSGVKIDSALTGAFNVSNILGAANIGLALGLPVDAIARGINSLAKVPGRLEAVPNSHGIHVLVDYAHKPDALEKVLHTLKTVKGPGRLITVFGCGGDRDRTKRPVMGKLAVENSDRVFITSDNPRTEEPDFIISEILKGVDGFQNFEVQADRKKAIEAALAHARAGDIVLIAGKGHEDYQIIGRTKTHFDDREVAADCLRAR